MRHRLLPGSAVLTAGVVALAALTAGSAAPAAANGNCVTYWQQNGIWSGAPAAGGTGTADDPYLVGSETDLSEIRFCPSAHFKQIADVALAPDWDPIATFTGVYRGAGHTISGLSIDRPGSDDQGLIASAQGALIADVSLTGVALTGNNAVGSVAGSALAGTEIRAVTVAGAVTGGLQVGLLVGRLVDSTVTEVAVSGAVTSDASDAGGIAGVANTSTITKVAVDATIQAPASLGGVAGSTYSTAITEAAATGSVIGGDTAGGLVGVLDGNRGLSKSTASVTVSGRDYVGGAVGFAYSDVAKVAVQGSVTGISGVGGLIGRSAGGRLLDSASAATVTGATGVGGAIGHATGVFDQVVSSGAVSGSTSEVGGLVGDLSNGTITGSSSSGAVTSGAEYNTGGLVGYLDGSEIVSSSATGTVTNTRAAPAAEAGCTGGLVGCVFDSKIRRASARGDVISAHGTDVGGLAGLSTGSVFETSVARGSVTAAGSAGGLVGRILGDAGRISNSYARGNVTSSGVAARVAGLVGEIASDPTDPPSWWTLSSSYATGAVSAPDALPEHRGGLTVGDAIKLQLHSFWNSTANPTLTAGVGAPRTATQLRERATYANADWSIQTGGGDETKTWGICVPSAAAVNDGFAFLSWEHAATDPCPAVPTAPTLTTVTGGDGLLHVVAALGSDSGSPITAVEYSLDDGPWKATGGASGTFSIAGLTNGTTYRVRVRAVNALGAGPRRPPRSSPRRKRTYSTQPAASPP